MADDPMEALLNAQIYANIVHNNAQEIGGDVHPLQKVFDDVLRQVMVGKGNERHGNGKDFMAQPWVDLANTHGIGFLTGQAAKKLDEAQQMVGERWEREMFGAIAYAAMAILHHRLDRQQ